jgi:carboxymethylenebutenolidase
MLANVDRAQIKTEEIHTANGTPAFLATPSGPGPHPVMVVLHERYGLVDHTRDVATRFAAGGHLAIAPNLFWREPDLDAIARAEARAEVADTQVCEDISSALDMLKDVSAADLTHTAVIGFCQTGRHPLVYASSKEGSDRVSACVVFHGAAYPREWVLNNEKVIPYDELLAMSQVPVFGAFGEKDFLISLQDVLRFRASLEAAQRSYQIRIWHDAPHSWLNDRLDRYSATQAESAWSATFAFLDRVYRGGFPNDRLQWEFVTDTARPAS